MHERPSRRSHAECYSVANGDVCHNSEFQMRIVTHLVRSSQELVRALERCAAWNNHLSASMKMRSMAFLHACVNRYFVMYTNTYFEI